MDRVEGLCNLCQNPIRKRVADGLWEDDESMTVCGPKNARHVLSPPLPGPIEEVEDDESPIMRGWFGYPPC